MRQHVVRALTVVVVLALGVGLALFVSRPAFAPGSVAPDFTAQDQDGKTFKLSEYRGKVVVVDFWGFW